MRNKCRGCRGCGYGISYVGRSIYGQGGEGEAIFVEISVEEVRAGECV